MQSLISFEWLPYYWRKVKGSHYIHQQTECSWGGFLIVVKANILSGLFVGCCACVIVYAVWDFVHNSHCGIMSCGILACGILSVGFWTVGFWTVGFCPDTITGVRFLTCMNLFMCTKSRDGVIVLVYLYSCTSSLGVLVLEYKAK